jgi:hypothetical protein
MFVSTLPSSARGRIVSGVAALTVAAVVALPAGAGAAPSSSGSAVSAKKAAAATSASGTKARKTRKRKVRCARGKVAVRRRGKTVCVRKRRRPAGSALREGGSRQTKPAATPPAAAQTVPAAVENTAAAQPDPSVPAQQDAGSSAAQPPANQSQRADWTIVDANGNAANLSALYPSSATVGGAPTYYRQGCSSWWVESGYYVAQCWSNSDRAHYYRYERVFYTVYGTWQVYATMDCVLGTCGGWF